MGGSDTLLCCLPREADMLARHGDRNFVRLSVCPSVTRVLCDETIERTANILTPYERVIILVLWFQRRLVGDVPFHLKFALKLTHPSGKRRLQPMSAHNAWTIRAGGKWSIIANRKSTMRFPKSYRWSALCTVPPTLPKGGSKSEFAPTVWKAPTSINVCS